MRVKDVAIVSSRHSSVDIYRVVKAHVRWFMGILHLKSCDSFVGVFLLSPATHAALQTRLELFITL